MWKIVLAVTGVLPLTGTSLPAAEWTRVTSPNFELYTTAGEKKGREAVLQFELVRDIFAKLLHSTPRAARPPRIVVFQNDTEFRKYSINEYAAAYYAGDRDHDYIVMSNLAQENYSVAIHEYTHLVVKHAGLHPPAWLDEGLAEFYSTIRTNGDKVQIGMVPPGRYAELRRNKWMDLASLLAVGHESPAYNEKKRAGLFYSQSWVLTHMLYLGDGYRGRIPDLMNSAASGIRGARTLEQIYGKDLAAIESDLRAYLRRDRLPAASIRVRLERSVEHPVANPATPLESGAMLAHLLLLTNRMDDAARAYGKLAADHPRSADIAVAQARLAWKRGDHAGIRRHFERAIDLGTTNAKVYFDYATMIEEDGGQANRVDSLLLKAVAIQPDLTEAQLMLGFRALHTERYPEALEHFGRVRGIAPERASSMYRAMSYANYRLGNKEQAIELAKSARKAARTAEEIREADQLLEYAAQGPPSRLVPTMPRDAMVIRPEPRTERLEGTLEHVDCLGEMAKLRVSAEGKVGAYLIRRPTDVRLRNSAGLTTGLTCGPQKPARVTLEYLAGSADAALATDGDVRTLEWK